MITALVLFLTGSFISSGVFAEGRAGKYLGERKMCLNAASIKETLILDDQTILFEMYGGTIYISRLPIKCDGLRVSGGFSYKISSSKLCKQEIITIVEEGPFHGSKCGLGEFILIKDVTRLSDAEKLLKDDGVLETLVNEGVFKTALSSEKSK
jgi:hypothetical protein